MLAAPICKLAWCITPRLLKGFCRGNRPASCFYYEDDYQRRTDDVFRLGIGVVIGWLAYEAFQKDKDKMSDIVKSCVSKSVEAIKNVQLVQKTDEDKETCTTTNQK